MAYNISSFTGKSNKTRQTADMVEILMREDQGINIHCRHIDLTQLLFDFGNRSR